MSKLDWKSYEELVKDIYEQLGSATGVKILGYGNGCKCTGKSGVEHQIDVLTSHSDGIHEYQTDIECKFWDQHINKDIVMKVEAVVAMGRLWKRLCCFLGMGMGIARMIRSQNM